MTSAPGIPSWIFLALGMGFSYAKDELERTMQTDRRKPMSAAFTVRIDEATLDALDRFAEKTQRSREWLVAKAIEEFVAVNAWQVERIDAGIAAADLGDFAPDAEVTRIRKKFAVGK